MPATFSDGSDDKPSYTEDGLSIVFSDYYDIYKRLVNDIDGSSLTLIASQSKYPVAWQGVYQAPGNQQTNTQDSTGQTNTGTTNTPIADIPGAECSPGAEQA